MTDPILDAPDSSALADEAASLRSAYVHIPFCARRCPYCDFAVVTPEEGGDDPAVARYVAVVLAEIGMEARWGPLDAVNLGGGTPSRLDPGALRSVLDAMEERFGFVAGAEVSLEANPEDVSDRLAEELVAAGFTRISLGVQSFDPAVLAALGRAHTPDEASAAISSAERSGFDSVNVDLIFGTVGESLDSWRRTVARALEFEPDHLSAYGLTVELGTALSRSVRAGAPAPDPDDQADKYEHLQEVAAGAGLVRYEISNYAKSGHHCRYNLGTWAAGEYLGFGLGAHDHREGTRHRNVRRLDAYLERVEAGTRPRAGSEHLEGFAADRERLMLGLRRAAGAVAGDSGRCLLDSPAGERLLAAGVISAGGSRIVVERPLLTDEVNRTLLSVSPDDC